MAGIDKIYGTNKQYDELYSWCEKHNKDALAYFYEKSGYGSQDRPIVSFPEHIDIWMFNNCPLSFVKNRIICQYGLDRSKALHRKFGIKQGWLNSKPKTLKGGGARR